MSPDDITYAVVKICTDMHQPKGSFLAFVCEQVDAQKVSVQLMSWLVMPYGLNANPFRKLHEVPVLMVCPTLLSALRKTPCIHLQKDTLM